MNNGAFGENFPYTNFHDLNMDWVIKIAKDFLDQYSHLQELIENGETSLTNLTTSGLEQLQEKADALESLLQEWYVEHSNDIAEQLASALADLNSWYNQHENYLDATLLENITTFNSLAEEKARQTIETIPSDYTALSNKVLALQNNQEHINYLESGTPIEVIFTQGTITAQGTEDESPIRIRSDYIETSDVKYVLAFPGYLFNVFYYDANKTFITKLPNWNTDVEINQSDYSYFRILGRKDNETNITPADSENIKLTTTLYFNIVQEIKNIKSTLSEIDNMTSSEIEDITWVQGGINAQGNDTDAYNRSRTNMLNTEDYTYIEIPEGNKINVYYYDDNDTFRSRAGTWITTTTYINKMYPKFRVVAGNSTDSGYNPDNASVIKIYSGTNHPIVDEIAKMVDFSDGYSIMADMIKRPVHTDYKGMIDKHQSFLVKEGYIYSANSTGISKQLGFTGNPITTREINIGHANAFQLGADGYGYVSGWDDNKIYKIDLTDISIAETINLPTTGYTTCAIDTLNKLAYIFQRDSYPDSTVNYNFIVYNYQTHQIISQKVINAMSAMQACDFYEGKIYVLYGGGTAYNPSGFIVYNTNGDIITEYNIAILENEEPEGIAIGRTSKNLYISIADKRVFEIK